MYHRLGANLGAGNVSMYRDFVVPAAMPAVIAGLKQGWAFSWRSLMAGELLVIIPGTQSIGTRLQFAREFSDSEGLMATMIVILVIGLHRRRRVRSVRALCAPQARAHLGARLRNVQALSARVTVVRVARLDRLSGVRLVR